MKAFLTSRVRKSVLKELNLVNFSFLDLADFIIDNRFLIFLPILLLLTQLDAS